MSKTLFYAPRLSFLVLVLLGLSEAKSTDITADSAPPKAKLSFIFNEFDSASGTGYRLSSGAQYWMPRLKGEGYELTSFQLLDSSFGYAVGVGRDKEASLNFFRTTDGGRTWRGQVVAHGSRVRGLSFLDKRKGFVVGDKGLIQMTTNGGESWLPVAGNVTRNLRAIHFAHPDTGFIVGDSGQILKTVDGGGSWISLTRATTKNLRALHFGNPSVGMVAGIDGTLLKTRDGGGTWTSVNSGLSGNLLGVYLADADHAHVLGDNGGIAAFDPEHPKGVVLNTEYGQVVAVYAFDRRFGLFAGSGGDSFHEESVPLPIEAGEATRVEGVGLLNHRGIWFSLSEEQHVKVTLVDMRGKTVGVLLDDKRSEGYYTLSWPTEVAAGRYLLEFRSASIKKRLSVSLTSSR